MGAQGGYEDYQKLTKNYKKQRRINVVVALDHVEKANAREIIKYVSGVYEEKFNISFNPLDFIKYSPGDSLRAEIEFEKIKKRSEKAGEAYILLTATDWQNHTLNPEREKEPLYGEALSYKGFVWTETCHKKQTLQQTLIHEIAHLFGAEHEEDSLSIMHPSGFNNQISWGYNTWKTILSNKFKRWDSE